MTPSRNIEPEESIPGNIRSLLIPPSNSLGWTLLASFIQFLPWITAAGEILAGNAHSVAKLPGLPFLVQSKAFIKNYWVYHTFLSSYTASIISFNAGIQGDLG